MEITLLRYSTQTSANISRFGSYGGGFGSNRNSYGSGYGGGFGFSAPRSNRGGFNRGR